MKGFLALAGKDIRDILRERSIVSSLVMQLFVAGFSTFLSVGLSGLYDPSSIDQFPAADVGYAGPGGFDDYLLRLPNVEVHYTNPEGGRAGFADGTLDALVEETGTNSSVRTVSLLLPKDSLEGTLLLTQLKGQLQTYEHDLRGERQARLDQQVLEIPQPPKGSSFGFVYGNLLPLLILVPVFLSGAIAGDAFMQESHTRTLLLLRSTPLSGAGIVAGKLVVPVLLAPLQVLLWVGLLALNHLPVHNLLLLEAVVTTLALLLASLSIGLAAWVKRPGQVQAGYAVLLLLFAVASLLLPADPLNLVALIATDALQPAVWATLLAYAAAAAAVTAVALPFVARRIRRDLV